jgi:hypothetical protein
MKLLLIKALSANHGYTQFIRSLAAALTALGHEPTITDQEPQVVNGAAPPDDLIRELQLARYDAVVSFSSFFGAVTLQNGAALYDHLGIRFLGWQLDHPIYAPQSLTRGLANRWSVYCNHNHLRFADALKLPGRGTTILAGAEPSPAAGKPYASRDWPVFIAANFTGEPQAIWEQMEESTGKALLTGVVKRLLGHREASLLDAFNDACADLGFGAKLGDDPNFDDQMIAFLREPLTYVRQVDRIALVRALAGSGLPVTLSGPGWRDYLGDRANVTFIDRWTDFADLSALYANAKIVINLNAGNGACERAVYAAAAGAAVVSDDSTDLAHQFAAPGEIAFYDRTQPGDVVAAVSRLMESDAGEAMAQAGQARVLQSGLWRHRAEQMIAFLETP